MFVLPVVISAYTFVMRKIKGYLLTYLFIYLLRLPHKRRKHNLFGGCNY